MNEWLGIFILAVIILSLIGLVITYFIGKTHRDHTKDVEMPDTVTKHRILMNPITMLNILFPVLAFIGAALFYIYYIAP